METVNLKLYADKITIFLFYLSAIVYITWGIIIIRKDFETGKIKNSLLIYALKYIGAVLFIHIIVTILGYEKYISNYFTLEFYLYYTLHILQSLIFSYILWYAEIWPAGDSKFYTINMFFLPLINPNISGFPNFLWISTMINIFIVAATYSIFTYIKENIVLLKKGDSDAFKEVKEYYLNEFKEIIKLKPKNIFTIFSVFSIFSYKQSLNLILQNHILNIFKRTDIFMFLMYFLWPKISVMLRTKYWKYTMIFFYSVLFIHTICSGNPIEILKNILTTAIKNTFKFGIIFAIGKVIFEKIIEAHNSFYASKEEIKPGMILSSKELDIIRKNKVFEGIFDTTFKDGLTEEQVEVLKKWMENHPDKNVKLCFVKAKPFAFNIFIGCLFQIVFNTNLIKFII